MIHIHPGCGFFVGSNLWACGPNFPFTTAYKKSLKFMAECRQIYIESYQYDIKCRQIMSKCGPIFSITKGKNMPLKATIVDKMLDKSAHICSIDNMGKSDITVN